MNNSNNRKTIFKLDSISQVHEILKLEKCNHPLITLIHGSIIDGESTSQLIETKILSNLYSINLKNGSECSLLYGRNSYDFQEGTMIFTKPGQTFTPFSNENPRPSDNPGWSLIFHPDLMRGSSLARNPHDYSYFSYNSHEALHLTRREIERVTQLVGNIEEEYSQYDENYDQEILVSHLELLLKYARRFYGRQFETRFTIEKNGVVKLEELLITHFSGDTLEGRGLPTVKGCAQELGYSPNYLSDFLKEATGMSCQDHIHFHLIEKAKSLLLSADKRVNEVAYSLGFDYPQHFSKLFKNKTGISPAEYKSHNKERIK